MINLFLKKCDSKEEMIQVFRHTINEAVDMSRGQVFIEDVISVFSEMGFDLHWVIKGHIF